MAPRTAKAKKAAEAKVTVNEAPKKGRGKAKNEVEPEQQDEKIEVIEKKAKRGKKNENNDEEKSNGVNEETAPPAKKGRAKKNPTPVEEKPITNTDNSAEESGTPAEENEHDNEELDTNGHRGEVPPTAVKGRKKAVKKETAETKIKENMRGKKVIKEDSTESQPAKKEIEEKPKGRGRDRKVQPKPESEEKSDNEDEPKPEPAEKPVTKGRKKAPTKAEKAALEAEKMANEVADKSKESETNEEIAETESIDSKTDEKGEGDVKGDIEPKKGKKGGKKAQAKEDKSENASEKNKNGKDAKDDEEMDLEAVVKPPKAKRGQKKAVEKPVEPEDVPDTGEPTSKRRRKAAEDKVEDTKKKVNKSATDFESIDFSNTSKNPQGKEWNFKISCWNVDGIRAWLGKGGLDYIKYEKPDILCLQEIKCARDKLPEEVTNIPGYHAYWLCSDKEGYAGVGIYTSKLAMNVQYGLQNEELDDEGRIITAEYEQFYLICTYVPNAGRKLVTLPKRLKWNEEFRKYVKALDEKKPVIICGDMNVSHNEIDLTNPKTNKKNAGFTEEERAGMTQLLADGFVDTFRHINPDKTGAYTFWSYMFNSRSKNVGWRLDYFIMSERLLHSLCDSVIRDKVYGSDHCPISLFLHLSTADKPKE
ncbi:DNA-(apurinic or apyrimidinic site) endonuclease-like [Zerene cesonia]|uniref:DNA-(apurinic or apyrimidinic site) endonuclease-like n=1 Tax=Zerene cesonia TaxID=33412 RepID=UPI0018E598C4|nr:DNA-(apurinic or apyrimidinic site) endonuclease-like [Zerene cesonia]